MNMRHLKKFVIAMDQRTGWFIYSVQWNAMQKPAREINMYHMSLGVVHTGQYSVPNANGSLSYHLAPRDFKLVLDSLLFKIEVNFTNIFFPKHSNSFISVSIILTNSVLFVLCMANKLKLI